MTASAVLTGVLLSLRLYLPGLALSWPLCSAPEPGRSRAAAAAASGAVSLAAGLSLNLAVVLFLGEAGWYRPGAEWGALAVLTAAGLLAGLRSRGRSLGRHALLSLPAAAGLAAAVALVLSAPSRGEWLLGGWDPGVYTNEGIALDRTGTLHPPDVFFHRALTPEEQKVFTRTGHNRTERFPGVVAEEEREAFTFEFFRLTPSMIALTHRTGGLPAATRVNTILGALALFLFAAALLWETGGAHAFFASVLLAWQPIWLYHTRTPVSEMLHLVLILGSALLMCQRDRSRTAPLLFSLLLFLLVLNRLSFVPFAGILILVLALADSGRDDRGRVRAERLLHVAAVLAAAGIDFVIAPYSPRGWVPFPPLFEVFGVCALAAVTVDLLPPRKAAALLSGLPDRARWAAGAFVLLVPTLMLLFAGGRLPVRADARNIFHLASYTGWPALAAAAAGGLLFFCRRRNASPGLKGFVFFLTAVGTLLLVQNWIFEVYPWATRRNLPYAVPAVALLAGYLPAHLWRVHGRFRTAGRSFAFLLLAALIASTAAKSRNALTRVEYEGLSKILAGLAQQVAPGDIVVVDDPRWGTPLALIHGREVFNGKHFWRRRAPEEMMRGLRSLERLSGDGRRVRFLTSTGRGLDIYPLAVEPVVLDWESGPLSLDEIVHSRRGSDFVTKEKSFLLRLYTWLPHAGRRSGWGGAPAPPGGSGG